MLSSGLAWVIAIADVFHGDWFNFVAPPREKTLANPPPAFSVEVAQSCTDATQLSGGRPITSKWAVGRLKVLMDCGKRSEARRKTGEERGWLHLSGQSPDPWRARG